jgi:hypothetical protein
MAGGDGKTVGSTAVQGLASAATNWLVETNQFQNHDNHHNNSNDIEDGVHVIFPL